MGKCGQSSLPCWGARNTFPLQPFTDFYGAAWCNGKSSIFRTRWHEFQSQFSCSISWMTLGLSVSVSLSVKQAWNLLLLWGLLSLKENNVCRITLKTVKPLYNFEELLVTLRSVRMWAPLHTYTTSTWKRAFTSQGFMAKAPVLSVETCLLLSLCCPGISTLNASTSKIHKLRAKENWKGAIMATHVDNMWCRSCSCLGPCWQSTEWGGGRCDLEGSTKAEGPVTSRLREWDFVPFSTLIQPENQNITDSFCPLWPL